MEQNHDATATRYLKQTMLKEVGVKGQQQLINAKVLVVGAGGLGCSVLQYLTAVGIGTIGIIDFDVVSESNLHRQVLYTVNDIGVSKVQVAKARLNELNPLVKIETYNERFTSKNAIIRISKYDIIVDCSDNFTTRYLINDACVKCNKPFIYGAIEAFSGQVAVFNYNNSATYRCLFPEFPTNKLNCNEIGVIGVLPSIIGSLQANECIKLILEVGSILINKLLVYDALNNEFKQYNFNRNNTAIDFIKHYPLQEENLDQCSTNQNIINISSAEFKAMQNEQNIIILDVRQIGEQPILHQPNVVNISLPLLAFKLQDLDKQKKYIVVCQSGARSKQASQLLIENNFTEVYNLENGLLNL